MFKKHSQEDKIMYFVVGILYVFSITLSVLSSTVLEFSPFYLFLMSAAIIFLLYFIFYNQYTFFTAFGITLFILLYLFFALKGADKESHAYYTLNQYLRDTLLFVRGYLPYDEKYTLIIVLSICLLISIYTILSLYITFQFYLLVLLGIGVFTISWAMDYQKSDLSFIIFLFCFFVLLSKKLGIMRSRTRVQKGEASGSVLFAMPICLLAIATAIFIPSPSNKPDATAAQLFFQRPVSAVNEFFFLAFHPKYFSFMTTGFAGQSNRLGGRVTVNHQTVMDIRADRRTYLAGAVREVYTGSAWNNAESVFLPYQPEQMATEYKESRFNLTQRQYVRRDVPYEHISDVYDTENGMPQEFYSLLLSDQDQSENIAFFDFLHELLTLRELSVDIGTARTGTLFRPAKSMSVDDTGAFELLINSHGDLRADKLLPSYTTYSYRYLSLDYDNDMLKDILRSCHKGYYDKNIREHERMTWQSVDKSDLPAQYAALAALAGSIYDRYTVLPETLPPRVASLAEELTRNFDNDYDKAKALEQYLVQFPYTLTPETVPRDRDFVDYFLFDGQEGYCTYYASAMAVMSRCIGLPSRYVEGYLMPESQNQNGVYSVTNELAHSWAEVYFEGFGWVPFEATAPYSYAFYQQPVPRNTPVFSSGFVQDSAYAEYLKQMAIRQSDYPQIVDAEAERAFEKKSTFIDSFVRLLRMLLVALLAVSIYYLFIGVRILQEKKRHEKIKTLAVNQQAQEYFKGILRMTRYYRYPIQANETPMQYANRIGRRFVFDNEKLSIHDLAQLYYKAKYGDSMITDRELLIMESAYYELIDYIRLYRRRQVFLWNRYVIGSM